MKQELILLATKKGFTSKMFSDTEWKHSDREDIRYYLWMCELYKWLSDNFLTEKFFSNSEMESNLLEVLKII